MSDQITVECPSGLVVVVREWGVREENLAANPETAREGRPKSRLLAAVTVALEDPGPYLFKAAGVNWDEVLHGDREVVALKNRINTWGADYDRDDQCPSCREPLDPPMTFDLNAFPVQKLPDSSLEHVRSGKPLSLTLPKSKKKVEYRLLRGKDESELAKIIHLREDEISSGALRLQIVSVEGVDKIDEWLPTMGSYDASYLRWATQQADCGVDQAGRWKCQCGHKWSADVSFGKGFLFPRFRAR